MSRYLIVSLIALSSVMAGNLGCTTALKQGYYEFRGAQGEIEMIQQNRPLRDVQQVTFHQVTTTAGKEIVPPVLMREYDRYAKQFLFRWNDMFPGGDPALTVDSEVLYYQKKGILSGALMLTRVKMFEQDDLAADMIVKVESKSFREGGEEDLSEAAIDTLEEFFAEQLGVVYQDEDDKEDLPAERGVYEPEDDHDDDDD